MSGKPALTITYCTQCNWLLRSAWMASELLSTFSLESAMLIERHAYIIAASYVIGSALLSIVALFCGLWLVRALYA